MLVCRNVFQYIVQYFVSTSCTWPLLLFKVATITLLVLCGILVVMLICCMRLICRYLLWFSDGAVLIVTADLVVEVLRCVESLLTYFSRAQDVDAKVSWAFTVFFCTPWACLFEHYVTSNKTFFSDILKVVLYLEIACTCTHIFVRGLVTFVVSWAFLSILQF